MKRSGSAAFTVILRVIGCGNTRFPGKLDGLHLRRQWLGERAVVFANI